MTQPHHHVFNALQGEINQVIKLGPFLPLMLERGVFKPENTQLFESYGMKALTGYLRNQDYDTFLNFLSCISDHPDGSKYMTLIETIREVVNEFDQRHESGYALKIDEIIKRHEKQAALELPPSLSSMASLSLEETATTVTTEVVSKEIPLPHLPYLEEPQSFTLDATNNYSYRIYEQEYGLVIEGNPGEEITFRIGLCTQGPFAIPDIYKVATCFLCIAANTKLIKPIKITMQHCLLMPTYEKSNSVLILHADHTMITSDTKSFTFSSLFIFGNKKGKIFPSISSSEPLLSFELQDLCILCGVLQEDIQKDHVIKQQPSHTCSSTCTCSHNHSTNEESTDDKGIERTDSFGIASSTIIAKQPSLEESAQEDSKLVPANLSPLSQRRAKIKRRHSNDEDTNKRICNNTLEYCLLLIEPVRKRESFSVCIFVLENCFTSEEECTRQGIKLCRTDDIEKNMIFGTFSDSKIHFDIMNDNTYWTICGKKSPINFVSENEFHIKKKNASYLAKQRVFPPKVEYLIHSKDGTMTHNLLFQIIIKGFECSDFTTDSQVSFTIAASPIDYIPPVPTNLINRFKSFPSSVKESPLFENEFALKIYQDITDWKKIGRLLGLEDCDLNAIEYDNPNHGRHELKYLMLLKWIKQSEPSQRTLEYIAKVLIKAKEESALCLLCDVVDNRINGNF